VSEPEGAPPGHRMRSAGPWPFVTFRSDVLRGRRIVGRARQHRKGLARRARTLENAAVPLGQTCARNWIMGPLLAVGSALFMLGAALSPMPVGPWTPPGALVNGVVFSGSVPFTIAGELPRVPAADAGALSLDPAGRAPHRAVSRLGWHPHNVGRLCTLTPFIGTVAFNCNTVDVFINLLGCVAFMAASVLPFVPLGPEPGGIPDFSSIHLFAGALRVRIRAVLAMRESITGAN